MKIRKTLLTAVVAAGCMAMSLGLVGCGPKAASDQALATEIQSKLYADPNARTANVKVNVSGGAVTLTGDAPSSDVALQVVNIANSTSGVKGVDNQLKITATPMAATQPSTQPSTMPPPPVTAAPVPQNLAPPRPVDDRPRRAERVAPLPPARPASVTIPAGTDIGIRMIDGINSKVNTSGQTFRASLSSPLVVDGMTVLPSGSGATVLLSNAKGAGRIKGNSELEVRLVSVEHAGRSYDVDTNVHEEVGKGRGKQTAVRSGIGAGVGAVIGALAGGGKGAAIGSIAGGGAGAGFQLATHGQQVSIPSETRLTFRLQSPLVVPVRGDRP